MWIYTRQNPQAKNLETKVREQLTPGPRPGCTFTSSLWAAGKSLTSSPSPSWDSSDFDLSSEAKAGEKALARSRTSSRKHAAGLLWHWKPKLPTLGVILSPPNLFLLCVALGSVRDLHVWHTTVGSTLIRGSILSVGDPRKAAEMIPITWARSKCPWIFNPNI